MASRRAEPAILPAHLNQMSSSIEFTIEKEAEDIWLRCAGRIAGSAILPAHLNQMSSSIEFTIEKEAEGRLAFLDVLVTHREDQLSTAVYRKPTHTDWYIPYHSKMLTGVMRGMRDRAFRICDNTSSQADGTPVASVIVRP